MEQQIAAESDQERLCQIEGISTAQSFNSILDYLEQMQQINDLEQSQEAQTTTRAPPCTNATTAIGREWLSAKRDKTDKLLTSLFIG